MFSGRSIRLAVQSRSWNPTQNEWKFAAQCVQLEEKDRIGRFVFKKDAKSAMVGRLLMRFAMSKSLDVPYRTLRFSRTQKGKPYLTNPLDNLSGGNLVSFNISHQGDLVVFAAERGRLVGVDVMEVEWPRSTPVADFFNSMKRQLTSQEWAEVNSRVGDMAQLKTFYRFWCLKESLVKALGTGIGFEVGRLNFLLRTAELSECQMTSDTAVEIDGELAEEWSFEETMITDHCVATAINTSSEVKDSDRGDGAVDSTVASFTIVDIKDLLAGCQMLSGTEPDMEYWEVFSSREEEPGMR